MSLLVGLTQRAEAELDAAYEWWARHRSVEQAVNWYNGVADVVQSLGDNPPSVAAGS
jgi:plasmid stabilization system protein ParE